MIAVLIAQFLSALADNALLFGALALLRNDHYPAWTAPLLQEFFVAAYILLAPFVGSFADSRPKGQVMLLANGLKLAGAIGILAGANPFLMYGLVGIGAAAYSPAKYGILSQLVEPTQLVRANGLIESSTIAAILAGAIAGGTLADWNVPATLAIVAATYALAALVNLLIPPLPALRPAGSFSPARCLREFGRALGRLVRLPEARLSLVGTSLFWGAGSTLRFLLVAWVPVALGIASNRMPAYLNAMVAVGIVIGAALAARCVSLKRAARVLPAGVLIGVAVCLLAGATTLPVAFGVMALIGVCGGYFIVPLNALLQERGAQSVGAGTAIGIQNLAENALMLLMIGGYMAAVHAGAPVRATAIAFGAALSLAIAALWISNTKQGET